MPTFDSLISRTDLAGTIPVKYSNEILSLATQGSNVMRLARRLRNMNAYQTIMPVLSALPTAYFVTGESGGSAGNKQTTEATWTNRTLQAEEVAAIIPIPESVLDDTTIDVWAELKPLIAEAIGKVIDDAVLWGTNKPSSWPTAIVTAAASASQTIAATASGDLYDHIMGSSGLISLVEGSGYMVTEHLAHISMRGRLRGLRETISGSATGMPLFRPTMQGNGTYELDGAPISFMRNGAHNDSYLMVSGQWDQLVYSVRQDMTWKILDQAIIQDNSGNIVYNLAQQDLQAMRVVIRLGFQIANPVNRVKSSGQYPFATYTPS